MIAKMFLWIFGMVLCMGIVSASYCYQESANVSNQTGVDGVCGLNYSGSYWTNGTNGNINWYDGDWDTYTSAWSPIAVLLVNYSKPPLATGGSFWTARTYGGSVVNENVTIVGSCWSQNVLQFKSVLNAVGVTGYCWNGSDFVSVLYHGFVNGRFYEEAMLWRLPELSVSPLSYNGSTFPNGTVRIVLNVSSIPDIFINTSYAFDSALFVVSIPQNFSVSDGSFLLTVNVTPDAYIPFGSYSGTINFSSNSTYNLSVSVSVNLSVDRLHSNSWCYQEYANVSTACGGLSSGSVGVNSSGDWCPFSWFNAFDGDWSTYTNQCSGSGLLFVNYSKPVYALNSSLWQVITDFPPARLNVSIPQSCWLADPLRFGLVVKGLGNFSCFNGSSWLEVWSGATSGEFYEEGMFWKMRGVDNVSVPSGLVFGQSFRFEVFGSGLAVSDWVNVSIVFPNGSVGSFNLSSADGLLWVSQNFTALNGSYIVNVSSLFNDLYFNFSIVNSHSVYPASFLRTASAGSNLSFTINVTSNTSAEINYSVQCYLNANFSCVLPSSIVVGVPGTNPNFGVSIVSGVGTPLGTYTGNITLIRAVDGATLIVNLSLGVSNDFGVPVVVNYSSEIVYMSDDVSRSVSFTLFNNGTSDLFNCSGSLSNYFSGLSFYSFSSGFVVVPNGSVAFNLSFNSPPIGVYSGYLDVACLATPNASLNSLSSLPLVVLVSSSPAVPSSGGGGGSIIVSNSSFSIAFDSGGVAGSFFVSPGGSRSLGVVLSSPNDKSVTLSCEGAICDGVSFSSNNFVLSNVPKVVLVTVVVPSTASFGDSFNFSVVASSTGESKRVEVSVLVSRVAGFLNKFNFFVMPGDEGYLFSVGNVHVPKLLFYVFVVGFFEVCLAWVLPDRDRSGRNPKLLWMPILGIVTFLTMVIIV